MTEAAAHLPAGPANGRRVGHLLLACAAAFVLVLVPYLPGLLGAGVFYVMAAPVHRRLARVVPPRVSAAALSLLLLVLILVPGGWLVATAVNEASQAFDAFRNSGALARLAAMRLGGGNLGEQLSGVGAQVVSRLSGQAVSLFGSATRATLNLCVALLGLYYLLVAGDGLGRRIRRLVPVPDAIFETLRARFVSVTEAMLLGTFLTAALQGALVGAAFVIAGLPAAVFWGTVTACAAVLPVMGSALVWLPAAGYLAAQGRYGAAAFMVVSGAVVVSNLDNLVWLAVYRRVSGIHPMVTLVGALAGMRVFGILGVLFGPLALSYFFELLDIYQGSPAAPDAARAAAGRPVAASAVAARA
ncbi:MAG TPA: AI-2E family transporter [Longimicrobium sp.]|nr:AI-2E family transporter [Longimicrobium sp.]